MINQSERQADEPPHADGEEVHHDMQRKHTVP